MSTDQILQLTREWAWSKGFRANEVYPVIRGGWIAMFYVREKGWFQP